jgi:flagellar protein FlaI
MGLFIPRESKIVSIEETREINLPHPNWIPGITRSGFGEVVNNKLVGEIDLFDLMKAALRQRPEYILVGEIRGKEAYVLFQAMATGHTTYSTVHADSVKALIHRMEGKPINIPRSMLQSLDIVLIQSNVKRDGKNTRRCRQIVELLNVDVETREVLTNTVFFWQPADDTFSYSGKSYILEELRTQLDLSRKEMLEELERRAEILEWMHRFTIREFTDVSQIILTYAETPDTLLEDIHKRPEETAHAILDKHASEEQQHHKEVLSETQRTESDSSNKNEKHAIVTVKQMFARMKKKKKSTETSNGGME